MKCCDKKPVIKLSGGENLCRSCFLKYFEKKVRKTIRIHNLIGKKENLGAIVNGNADSLVVFDILSKITKENKKIQLINISDKSIEYFFNEKSKLNITKIATGNTLDDEAQSIILYHFLNDKKIISELGPIIKINKSLQWVKPLYFCSNRDVLLYAKLKKIKYGKTADKKIKDKLRKKVADMLDELEAKFPGTKNSIVNSFLEVLPLLRDK